jgi:hypothetical protein
MPIDVHHKSTEIQETPTNFEIRIAAEVEKCCADFRKEIMKFKTKQTVLPIQSFHAVPDYASWRTELISHELLFLDKYIDSSVYYYTNTSTKSVEYKAYNPKLYHIVVQFYITLNALLTYRIPAENNDDIEANLADMKKLVQDLQIMVYNDVEKSVLATPRNLGSEMPLLHAIGRLERLVDHHLQSRLGARFNAGEKIPALEKQDLSTEGWADTRLTKKLQDLNMSEAKDTATSKNAAKGEKERDDIEQQALKAEKSLADAKKNVDDILKQYSAVRDAFDKENNKDYTKQADLDAQETKLNDLETKAKNLGVKYNSAVKEFNAIKASTAPLPVVKKGWFG